MARKKTITQPGAQPSRTSGRLSRAGKPSKPSPLDAESKGVSQSHNIGHKDPATLLPTELAESPLNDIRAPVDARVGFMDLPPELRQMVYDLALPCLLPAAGKTVKIQSYKAAHEPRIACRVGRFGVDLSVSMQRRRPESKTNALAAFLTLNKQIAQEAGSYIYGTSIFEFYDLVAMGVFLENINHVNRAQLRYLGLRDCDYTASTARSALSSLQGATQLRHTAFHPGAVCCAQPLCGTASRDAFLLDLCQTMLKLRGDQQEETVDIRDLFEVQVPESVPCDVCRCSRHTRWCEQGRHNKCSVRCADMAEHCKALNLRIRGRITKGLLLESVTN